MSRRRVDALDNKARAGLRNREIAFAFQAFKLMGDLSVEDNVALVLAPREDAPGYKAVLRIAASRV